MKINVDMKGTAVANDNASAIQGTVTLAPVADSPVSLVKTAEPVAVGGVVCLDAGHAYMVTGGQMIKFIKRVDGQLINEGTTNEELLQVLIDRTKFLDNKFPCKENAQAIVKMEEALMWFNERTSKRIAQGVETRDIAHQDIAVANS